MGENLLEGCPFGRIYHQHLPQKISSLLIHGGGYLILSCFDSCVGFFDVVCLEGRTTCKEDVHDDSSAPDIYLEGMTLKVLDNLRGDVVGRSTDSPLAFSRKLEFCC